MGCIVSTHGEAKVVRALMCSVEEVQMVRISCFWPMAMISVIVGCGRQDDYDNRHLRGGGATFIDPIMQVWSHDYYDLTGIEIDYSKSGSSDGIKQMTDFNLDFGCSDAPMKRDQVKNAQEKGGEVIHIPLIMGAVAITYNLPNLPDLHLSGPVLADIYLGKLKKWNDPQIQALNPTRSLPDLEIVPVYRSDGSGTTNIFTEYLGKTSPEFAKAIPASTQPKWPQIGLGQKGNDGIAGHIKNNEGCIGYVEVSYAKMNHQPTALMQNARGKFVGPETEGVIAAGEAAIQVKQAKEPYSLHTLTYSLTNADHEHAYPICGINYAVLYQKQPAGKGKTMVDFLRWATSEGQRYAVDLHYAPLPNDLSKKISQRLDQVVFE
jgi:phosphate ABC transporter phosphate-binding protein